MKALEGVHFLANECPVAATVGMFDGVHRGHRALIEHLLSRASELRCTAALISFWPHPQHLISGTSTPLLLSTEEERRKLLSETGLPYLITLPFTQSLANLDKDAFIEGVLLRGIGVRHLIVGSNHRFGKGGRGGFSDLEARAAQGGFDVEACTSVQIDGARVSSTIIRSALTSADLSRARQMLGYRYTFSGEVVEGQRLGRSIGFPTANLRPLPSKLMPSEGVYAVEVQIALQWHKGMLYIGQKSIEGQATHTIEVHIFEFDDDLYGQVLKVCLHSYLRGSKRLTSKQSLSHQLHLDKAESLRILNT